MKKSNIYKLLSIVFSVVICMCCSFNYVYAFSPESAFGFGGTSTFKYSCPLNFSKLDLSQFESIYQDVIDRDLIDYNGSFVFLSILGGRNVIIISNARFDSDGSIHGRPWSEYSKGSYVKTVTNGDWNDEYVISSDRYVILAPSEYTNIMVSNSYCLNYVDTILANYNTVNNLLAPAPTPTPTPKQKEENYRLDNNLEKIPIVPPNTRKQVVNNNNGVVVIVVATVPTQVKT